VHVRSYVCVCVCIYVCIYIYIYIYISRFIHIHIHTHEYMHTYTRRDFQEMLDKQDSGTDAREGGLAESSREGGLTGGSHQGGLTGRAREGGLTYTRDGAILIDDEDDFADIDRDVHRSDERHAKKARKG
jgi:hypothetical protein